MKKEFDANELKVELLEKASKLNDLKLLELAGVILEMVDGRGKTRTNDLVMSVIDVILETEVIK